jgi:hypothetical protein
LRNTKTRQDDVVNMNAFVKPRKGKVLLGASKIEGGGEEKENKSAYWISFQLSSLSISKRDLLLLLHPNMTVDGKTPIKLHIKCDNILLHREMPS